MRLHKHENMYDLLENSKGAGAGVGGTFMDFVNNKQNKPTFRPETQHTQSH